MQQSILTWYVNYKLRKFNYCVFHKIYIDLHKEIIIIAGVFPGGQKQTVLFDLF